MQQLRKTFLKPMKDAKVDLNKMKTSLVLGLQHYKNVNPSKVNTYI